MMPKGPLGRQMLTKVRIYAGSEHKNAAQKPEDSRAQVIGKETKNYG